MDPEQRFERLASAAVGGFKKANRTQFYPLGEHLKLLSVGDFMSRLWARFGAPDSVGQEGFTYSLIDRETGDVFRAYAAGSGPAYGGDASLDVLEIFERWIAATDPVDCEIVYDTDFGTYRSGARNGISFDECATPRGKKPRR